MWSQGRDGWGEYFAGSHLAQSRSTCQMKVGESGPSLGWNLGSTATPPPPPLSSVWKSTSTWCPLSWDFTDAGTLRYELGKGGSGSFLSDICYRSVWFDLVWFDLMWKGEGLQQVRRSRQAGLRLRALWCRLLWRLCLHQKGDNSIQNITKTNKIKLICLRLATGTRWFANRATTVDCDSHKIVDCWLWFAQNWFAPTWAAATNTMYLWSWQKKKCIRPNPDCILSPSSSKTLIIIRQPNPKYATTVTCPHVIKPMS